MAGKLGLGAGALTGLFAGFSVGSATMAIFSSGAKTVLTCWAEDPDRLDGMPNSLGGKELIDEFEHRQRYDGYLLQRCQNCLDMLGGRPRPPRRHAELARREGVDRRVRASAALRWLSSPAVPKLS